MTCIELTEEQRRFLETEPGKPVHVIDPATNRAYVLLAREQFEKVRSLLLPPETTSSPQEESVTVLSPRAQIAPLMLRSQQAFWRDLPELLQLKSRKRQWVAYHGDERIGFGQTDVEVYQECFRRGLERGAFYVGKLKADPEGIPPWGTLECDWSLYEVTDDDEGGPSDAV